MNKKILPLLLIVSLSSCNNQQSEESTVDPTQQPTIEMTPMPPEVTQIPSEEISEMPTEIPTIEPSEEPFETKYTNIFVVGDSTMASFNDETYYYPRFGYATQLDNYLIDKANIINLALSGRSSITAKQTLCNSSASLSVFIIAIPLPSSLFASIGFFQLYELNFSL